MLHKVKKIVLLPPAEIVKHDKALAEISKNDHALDPPAETKLKGSALVAQTSLNVENYVDAAPCHTMLCRHVLLSHVPTLMSSKVRLVVPNLFVGVGWWDGVKNDSNSRSRG